MQNVESILRNEKQLEYLRKIRDYAKEETDIWISTPNKSFGGRCPLDLLLSENYDYFDRIFGK